MKRWLYQWLPIVFGCHCREDRSFHIREERFPICARCTGLMRPAGESMKTLTPSCPRKACSAAEPVSPEVAPRMLRTLPCLAST